MISIRKAVAVITALVCMHAADCGAQSIRSLDPGAVQKKSTDTFELRKQEKEIKEEKKEQGEAVEDKTVPAEEERLEGEASFLLKKVETGSSDILTAKELEDVTRKYEQRVISIKDLFKLVDDINKLYESKNIITARAFLPPQKIEDGVVKVRLVESRLGKVLVKGNEHTNDSFIKGRVSIKPGEHIRLDSLEDDLLFFNNVYDVNLKAKLVRGEKFGTTDCVLLAEEPENYQALAYVDNAGNKGVGEERFGLLLGVRSLLGFRDRFTVGGIFADGTLAAHVSYDFPVTAWGTRLGAYYDYNQIEVNSGPFAGLDISGDAFDIGVYLNQAIWARPGLRVNGFVRANVKDSTTRFSGIKLLDNQVRSLSYGFDITAGDGGWILYLGQGLTNGFDAFGGDKNFLRYNLNMVSRANLGGGAFLILKGGGQVSDSDLLPPSEQFQLGGMATVRGYPEGLLIGDDGYALSAELAFPLPFFKWEPFGFPLHEKVKGAAFVDHGGAFPFKGAGESIDSEDFLTSVGFGLIFEFTKYFSGRVYAGFPITGGPPAERDTVRVHFYVQSELF